MAQQPLTYITMQEAILSGWSYIQQPDVQTLPHTNLMRITLRELDLSRQ